MNEEPSNLMMTYKIIRIEPMLVDEWTELLALIKDELKSEFPGVYDINANFQNSGPANDVLLHITYNVPESIAGSLSYKNDAANESGFPNRTLVKLDRIKNKRKLERHVDE